VIILTGPLSCRRTVDQVWDDTKGIDVRNVSLSGTKKIKKIEENDLVPSERGCSSSVPNISFRIKLIAMGSASSTSSGLDHLTYTVMECYLDLQDNSELQWDARLQSCREKLALNGLSRGVPGRVLCKLSSHRLFQLATMLPPAKAELFTLAALQSDDVTRSTLLTELIGVGICFDDSHDALTTTSARMGHLGLSLYRFVACLTLPCGDCVSYHDSVPQLHNRFSGSPHSFRPNKRSRLSPSGSRFRTALICRSKRCRTRSVVY
jgi:hypothetical protein